MLLNKIRKIMVVVLFLSLSLTLVCSFTEKVSAVSAGDKIDYPFKTGEYAFYNTPNFTAPTVKSTVDKYVTLNVSFGKTVDFTNATYLAIQIKYNTKGQPGMQYGVVDANNNRFGFTEENSDGKPAYHVNSSGVVSAKNIQYAHLSINNNEKNGMEMILIPMNLLTSVDGNIEEIGSFYMETNQLYNYKYTFQLGEIGYYTGEPSSSTYNKLVDVVDETNCTVDGYTVEFPAKPVDSYPFGTTVEELENTMIWTSPDTKDTYDNWQRLTINFQDGHADFTDATYLAIQVQTLKGTPGLTYGLETGTLRYSIAGSNDQPVYLLRSDGTTSELAKIKNDAVTASINGCVLIPMNLIKYETGEDDSDFLKTVDHVIISTNSHYNYNWELLIGGVGYYTGEIGGDFVYHSLVDIKEEAKTFLYQTDCDNIVNPSSVRRNKLEIIEEVYYGDSAIAFFATGLTDGSRPARHGGAYGEQTMTKDSYGDDALKLTCTGANPKGDQYAAFTLIDNVQIDWSKGKGVTLWVRNDSSKEVSFNVELDIGFTNTAIFSKIARFNVRQNYQFWLYDVNTGKQTIYMTRPLVTLPAGFEGWVRIPFEAFKQAEWSVDQKGAFPHEYFMTEGCYVNEIGISIFLNDFVNQPISINKIGTYLTTPTFVSPLVPATDEHKDILGLMGLN